MKHDSIGANWPGRDGCAIDRRRNEASVSNEPLFIFHFSLSLSLSLPPKRERKKSIAIKLDLSLRIEGSKYQAAPKPWGC